MGEYAKHQGHQIKIGTCEQMYYLRADQVEFITPEHNSVNPHSLDTAGRIRFRFPFPDEDGVTPGAFQDYNRALAVWGVEVPEGVAHGSLQFTRNYPAAGGIILSTPCPESQEGKASGLRFGYNGYAGKVGIHSQRLIDGQLKLVCSCGSCGALWRNDTLDDCAAILNNLRAEAARDPKDARAKLFSEVAARIEAGYTKPNYWTPQNEAREAVAA